MMKHLSKIFTTVLMTGEMPEEWQKAIVKPIFKSGDRHDWANYRLISLISVVGKLFEAVIAARINDAFEEHKMFTDMQFGFRRGRSCRHAQYTLVETIKARARQRTKNSDGRQQGKDTHVCFLDLRKAYPTTLLTKLQSMINKIRGTRPDQRSKVWTVIHKMHENVVSFVRINSDGVEEDSSDYEVRHGLREGSCLSPTLFAIFINDLIQKLEEADVECVLEGFDLRGILYANDIALIAVSAKDLRMLINKAGEHADINQYQFSYK